MQNRILSEGNSRFPAERLKDFWEREAVDLIRFVVAIRLSHRIQSWLEPKSRNDTEIAIRSISVVFTQEEFKDGRRHNLGTFPTRKAAEAHERAVQYFKRHG